VAAIAGCQTFAVSMPAQAAGTRHWSAVESSALREFDDPMHWIVEPNALAHGVGEDRAEQCHGCGRRHHDHVANRRDDSRRVGMVLYRALVTEPR
jgi:hypothetical protein